MVKVHRPMILLVISRTVKQMKNFLKGFEKMSDVVLMPNDIIGNTSKWRFIRDAVDTKKRIILYAITRTERREVEDEISKISYHFRCQSNYNIVRVMLDDGKV